MRTALLIMFLVAVTVRDAGAAAPWVPGKPVPGGSLVERPVVVAVVLRHDRPAEEAQKAFAELAHARFPDVSIVKEVPKGPMPRGPVAHAAAVDVAKQPLLTGDLFNYTTRRLTPAEKTGLSAAKGVLVLSYMIDPVRRPDLASVCALSHAVADKLHAFMEDGESRDIFTPAHWKAARLDSWQGAIPAVWGHVTVLPFKRGAVTGVEMLGLRRFGLPDLAVNGIGAADAAGAGGLLTYVAQQLVERPRVDTGAFVVKANALMHAKMRAPQAKDAAGISVLRLMADPSPPGAYNPRRMTLAPAPEETPSAFVQRSLRELAGPPQEVVMPPHQETALDAARGRAQTRIAELAKIYQAKAPDGAELRLKAPFATASGGREWMWVQVESWAPGKVTGKLLNAPVDVPGAAEGQAVTVPDTELFDYLYTAPGQPPEGGQTDRVVDPAGP